MRTKAIFAAMLLALAPLPSVSQDFDVGRAAYASGDYDTALREWKPLAEQGSAVAQYNLGVLYAKGQGVAQDYAEAARWYSLATVQGSAIAAYNLGLAYAYGQGVAQDPTAAELYITLAAAMGQRQARVCKDSGFKVCN